MHYNLICEFCDEHLIVIDSNIHGISKGIEVTPKMDTILKTVLWQQFGAAIDMFGNAMNACPDSLWLERLWDHPGERAEFSQFWYITYHTLFWLDLYLSGAVEGFAPPPPYTLDELDPAGLVPDTPYTREELRSYLAHGRKKCQATIEALTDETLWRRCKLGRREFSFAELLLYTMRHVQEHGAQLNLFLGQKRISIPGWVGRASDETP